MNFSLKCRKWNLLDDGYCGYVGLIDDGVCGYKFDGKTFGGTWKPPFCDVTSWGIVINGTDGTVGTEGIYWPGWFPLCGYCVPGTVDDWIWILNAYPYPFKQKRNVI